MSRALPNSKMIEFWTMAPRPKVKKLMEGQVLESQESTEHDHKEFRSE